MQIAVLQSCCKLRKLYNNNKSWLGELLQFTNKVNNLVLKMLISMHQVSKLKGPSIRLIGYLLIKVPIK